MTVAAGLTLAACQQAAPGGPGNPCATGLEGCGGVCVDTLTDINNCGGCAIGCLAGFVCVSGSCVCPSGLSNCSGRCLDLQADDQNCGKCSNACSGAGHCVTGQCVQTRIQHVVLIVQENHTFDAYFGAYCQQPAGSNPSCTTGPACCEAAPAADPSGASPLTLDDSLNTSRDPNHSQACEVQEIDNGKMDQFVTGASGGASLCASACSSPQNFAVTNSSTLGSYWSLADGNALADRYFQPIVGSTSSNDMYFAVAHVQFVDNDLMPGSIGAGCIDPTGICVNGKKTTFTGRTTIGDLLVSAGRTFAVYADGYAEAVAAGKGSCASIPSYCTWDILHPLLERSCLYDPSDIPFQYYAQFQDNPAYMKDYADLATDVAAGTLPDFVYVKARTYRNEHPEYSTIGDGVQFVTTTLSTIQSSVYAADTLILLTWDEGGGFFDHVPPPAGTDTDDAGNPVPHGTRVPFLAIGPFARVGAVSHVTMDHASVVRFLEYNFVGPVGQLGYSDAKVNNIGSLLDPEKTGIVVPDGP